MDFLRDLELAVLVGMQPVAIVSGRYGAPKVDELHLVFGGNFAVVVA